MVHELPVTATDIWYYFICKRECWLMMHKIVPDQEDENVEIGRFLHDYKYGKGIKEVTTENIKMDRIRKIGGKIVVQEIKKSSRFYESSRYQLLYYLLTLKQMGIHAVGELKFTEERKSEQVELTEQDEQVLHQAIEDIQNLSRMPVPPAPKKIRFCRQCAYREYCWAEE